MSPSEGDTAPDFELPGYHDGRMIRLRLTEVLGNGDAALLSFYCCDFSPVCTRQMCDYRDADWYDYKRDLRIIGINRESTFAHEQFAETHDLSYPLLSDVSGRVHRTYDTLTDFEGMEDVTRRAAFLVDSDQVVRYAYRAEDNWDIPELNPIQEAIKRLP